MASLDQLWAALRPVQDPEIGRSLVELNMIAGLRIEAGVVDVEVTLTVSGCPMRETITSRVHEALGGVAGVEQVRVTFGVMDDEQRRALRQTLTGAQERAIPFAEPGSLTRVIAIASGKGGVGKSSVTANLAAALAAEGHSVGLIDADVYGHSIPRMLGLTTAPTFVEGLFMPPTAHGVKVMSLLPFKPGGVAEPVAYRGPMLHKVLQQFLADTWWGDLDFLLLDLPPGTGDMPMSLGQTLPNAEVVVVTTAHTAAAEVAVRAGMLAHRLRQRVLGVVENMSTMVCPHCGERSAVFGAGGADEVSRTLEGAIGSPVPVLARITYDASLADPLPGAGPFVVEHPDSPAAAELRDLARSLAARPRGLVGRPLSVSPAR
ncbi:MAG: P-loop NTPase [Actinomycetales bacterium]|nr:P-loop NTPase [Actinomycetales bacterium]